ncbi:hypothetical protein [Desulfosediminicola ganghwensis]|uniref:hypothetical protein n=1 Tax=Desulfosediminicola ganghwensis TaxID=2569540 RepID=UPI0010ADA273|nr:hypothetical protein [Desulfosediminicola ganghwensis]
MRKIRSISLMLFVLCFIVPAMAIAGKGFMGGKGTVVADEPPEDTGGAGGSEGPVNDKKSDAGKLYGDLYKVLRQAGGAGDTKLVPDGDGNLEVGYNTIGGEPVLTVIDPEDLDGRASIREDYGWYAKLNADGTYELAQSSSPALCVQPVASYERWGDISSKTGLTKNRLPLIITYDPTWGRSECEVGKLTADPTVNLATGELTLTVEQYFIKPGGTWTDAVNGTVTYANGVLWTDLIEEVHFGRLNLSRAPEAVLQSAFDEAINTINSPDTVGIELDAAGRILLEKNVYDDIRVESNGEPMLLGTIKKAIDSPLENVALYLKLMKDGHLVTPSVERMPIDRSLHGGIPLWKLLELEDGPADASLRPTIDIEKMEAWGLSNLVDVSAVDYYSYYQCTGVDDEPTACLCPSSDSVETEHDGEVMCADVVDRQLATAAVCPADETCFGPFYGITAPDGGAPDAADLSFAASFLAAGADKTGDISVDMIVYLNSILGINKVVGYSSYDDNGEPTGDAVSYEDNPVYFDFNVVSNYSRENTFAARGAGGFVTVLQGESPDWKETGVEITGAQYGEGIPIFNNLGKGSGGFPNGQPAADNIQGFTQEADDDLSVIEFVHTYQIPGLR